MDFEEYFRRQARKLDEEYKGSLVKDHHGDTGSNREKFVQEWLLKHLPRTVTPELGGKIIDETGYTSLQADLIIYDDSLPRFGAIDKSYYFSEGVFTAIQVKSKLTSQQLSKAVNNLASIKKCKISQRAVFIPGGRGQQIPTGIFAFEKDDEDYPSIESIIKALKRHESKGAPPVDFVYINKVAYIVYNTGTWNTIDDETGEIVEKTPLGYFLVEASESCIWRMLLNISTNASRDIGHPYDFQKYFLNKKPSQGKLPDSETEIANGGEGKPPLSRP